MSVETTYELELEYVYTSPVTPWWVEEYEYTPETLWWVEVEVESWPKDINS